MAFGVGEVRRGRRIREQNRRFRVLGHGYGRGGWRRVRALAFSHDPGPRTDGGDSDRWRIVHRRDRRSNPGLAGFRYKSKTGGPRFFLARPA